MGTLSRRYHCALRGVLASGTEGEQRARAKQAGRAIEYNVAKREVDTIRALYDTMLQKVRESGTRLGRIERDRSVEVFHLLEQSRLIV